MPANKVAIVDGQQKENGAALSSAHTSYATISNNGVPMAARVLPLDCYVELVQPKVNGSRLGADAGSSSAKGGNSSGADIVLNFRRRDRSGNGKAFFLLVNEGLLGQLRHGERGEKALHIAKRQQQLAREEAGRSVLDSYTSAVAAAEEEEAQGDATLSSSRPHAAGSSGRRKNGTMTLSRYAYYSKAVRGEYEHIFGDLLAQMNVNVKSDADEGGGHSSAGGGKRRGRPSSSSPQKQLASQKSFRSTSSSNRQMNSPVANPLSSASFNNRDVLSSSSTTPPRVLTLRKSSLTPITSSSFRQSAAESNTNISKSSVTPANNDVDAGVDAFSVGFGHRGKRLGSAALSTASNPITTSQTQSPSSVRLPPLSPSTQQNANAPPLPPPSPPLQSSTTDHLKHLQGKDDEDAALVYDTLFDACVTDPQRLKMVAVQSSSMLRHTGAIEAGFTTVTNGCGTYNLKSFVAPETNYKIVLLVEYDDEEVLAPQMLEANQRKAQEAILLSEQRENALAMKQHRKSIERDMLLESISMRQEENQHQKRRRSTSGGSTSQRHFTVGSPGAEGIGRTSKRAAAGGTAGVAPLQGKANIFLDDDDASNCNSLGATATSLVLDGDGDDGGNGTHPPSEHTDNEGTDKTAGGRYSFKTNSKGQRVNKYGLVVKQKVCIVPCVDTVQLRYQTERARPVSAVSTVSGMSPWQYQFLLSTEHAQSAAASYIEFIESILRRNQKSSNNSDSCKASSPSKGRNSSSTSNQSPSRIPPVAEALANTRIGTDAYVEAIERYVRYNWSADDVVTEAEAIEAEEKEAAGGNLFTPRGGASGGVSFQPRSRDDAPPPFTPSLLDARVTIRGVTDPLCGRYISLIQTLSESYHKTRWMMRCDAKMLPFDGNTRRDHAAASHHRTDASPPLRSSNVMSPSALATIARYGHPQLRRGGLDPAALTGRYTDIIKKGADHFHGVGGQGRHVYGLDAKKTRRAVSAGPSATRHDKSTSESAATTPTQRRRGSSVGKREGSVREGVPNSSRSQSVVPSSSSPDNADLVYPPRPQHRRDTGSYVPQLESAHAGHRLTLDVNNFAGGGSFLSNSSPRHNTIGGGGTTPQSQSVLLVSPRSENGVATPRSHHVITVTSSPTASPGEALKPPPPILLDEMAHLTSAAYPPPPPMPTPGTILEVMASLGCAPQPVPDLKGPWVLDWYDFVLLVTCTDEGVLKRIGQIATQYNAYEMEGETLIERLRWMCLPEKVSALPALDPSHGQKKKKRKRAGSNASSASPTSPTKSECPASSSENASVIAVPSSLQHTEVHSEDGSDSGNTSVARSGDEKGTAKDGDAAVTFEDVLEPSLRTRGSLAHLLGKSGEHDEGSSSQVEGMQRGPIIEGTTNPPTPVQSFKLKRSNSSAAFLKELRASKQKSVVVIGSSAQEESERDTATGRNSNVGGSRSLSPLSPTRINNSRKDGSTTPLRSASQYSGRDAMVGSSFSRRSPVAAAPRKYWWSLSHRLNEDDEHLAADELAWRNKTLTTLLYAVSGAWDLDIASSKLRVGGGGEVLAAKAGDNKKKKTTQRSASSPPIGGGKRMRGGALLLPEAFASVAFGCVGRKLISSAHSMARSEEEEEEGASGPHSSDEKASLSRNDAARRSPSAPLPLSSRRSERNSRSGSTCGPFHSHTPPPPPPDRTEEQLQRILFECANPHASRLSHPVAAALAASSAAGSTVGVPRTDAPKVVVNPLANRFTAARAIWSLMSIKQQERVAFYAVPFAVTTLFPPPPGPKLARKRRSLMMGDYYDSDEDEDRGDAATNRALDSSHQHGGGGGPRGSTFGGNGYLNATNNYHAFHSSSTNNYSFGFTNTDASAVPPAPHPLPTLFNNQVQLAREACLVAIAEGPLSVFNRSVKIAIVKRRFQQWMGYLTKMRRMRLMLAERAKTRRGNTEQKGRMSDVVADLQLYSIDLHAYSRYNDWLFWLQLRRVAAPLLKQTENAHRRRVWRLWQVFVVSTYRRHGGAVGGVAKPGDLSSRDIVAARSGAVVTTHRNKPNDPQLSAALNAEIAAKEKAADETLRHLTANADITIKVLAINSLINKGSDSPSSIAATAHHTPNRTEPSSIPATVKEKRKKILQKINVIGEGVGVGGGGARKAGAAAWEINDDDQLNSYLAPYDPQSSYVAPLFLSYGGVVRDAMERAIGGGGTSSSSSPTSLLKRNQTALGSVSLEVKLGGFTQNYNSLTSLQQPSSPQTAQRSAATSSTSPTQQVYQEKRSEGNPNSTSNVRMVTLVAETHIPTAIVKKAMRDEEEKIDLIQLMRGEAAENEKKPAAKKPNDDDDETSRFKHDDNLSSSSAAVVDRNERQYRKEAALLRLIHAYRHYMSPLDVSNLRRFALGGLQYYNVVDAPAANGAEARKKRNHTAESRVRTAARATEEEDDSSTTATASSDDTDSYASFSSADDDDESEFHWPVSSTAPKFVFKGNATTRKVGPSSPRLAQLSQPRNVDSRRKVKRNASSSSDDGDAADDDAGGAHNRSAQQQQQQQRIGGAYQRDPSNPQSKAYKQRLDAILNLHARVGGLSRSFKPVTSFDAAQRSGQEGTVGIETLRRMGKKRVAAEQRVAATIEKRRQEGRRRIVTIAKVEDHHNSALLQIGSSLMFPSHGDDDDYVTVKRNAHSTNAAVDDAHRDDASSVTARTTAGEIPPIAALSSSLTASPIHPPPRRVRSVRMAEKDGETRSAHHSDFAENGDFSLSVEAGVISTRPPSTRCRAGEGEEGSGACRRVGEDGNNLDRDHNESSGDSSTDRSPFSPEAPPRKRYFRRLLKGGRGGGAFLPLVAGGCVFDDVHTPKGGAMKRARIEKQKRRKETKSEEDKSHSVEPSSSSLAQPLMPTAGFALSAAPSAGLSLQHHLALELLPVNQHRTRLTFFLKWCWWAQSSILARNRAIFLSQSMQTMMLSNKNNMLRVYYKLWREAIEEIVRKRNRERAVKVVGQSHGHGHGGSATSTQNDAYSNRRSTVGSVGGGSTGTAHHFGNSQRNRRSSSRSGQQQQHHHRQSLSVRSHESVASGGSGVLSSSQLNHSGIAHLPPVAAIPLRPLPSPSSAK